MNRRSFLSLLAAAFASPLIGQLDPFVPSTGPINIRFGWESVESFPASWHVDVAAAVEAIRADVDKRAAEYAYGVMYGKRAD